jgi:hypothetical protein
MKASNPTWKTISSKPYFLLLLSLSFFGYKHIVLWRIGWYTPLIRRDLVPMTGFISSWDTHSLLIIVNEGHTKLSLFYSLSTIYNPPLHTHYDSASTSRLLATDLNTESICLKTLLLRNATLAWRDVLLPVTVTLFRDLQYPWALSFGLWRRSAASFRTLRRFLSPLTGITTASPMRISWCN